MSWSHFASQSVRYCGTLTSLKFIKIQLHGPKDDGVKVRKQQWTVLWTALYYKLLFIIIRCHLIINQIFIVFISVDHQ